MKGDRFFEVMIRGTKNEDEGKPSFREKCETLKEAQEKGKELLVNRDNINVGIWEWEHTDESDKPVLIRIIPVVKES